VRSETRPMIPVSEALARATRALATALKHRDLHTQMHSERVIAISLALGKACGFTESELEDLYISAQLHDIGKVGINDNVLLKPDILDETERELIETHCAIGEDIVKCLEFENSDSIASAVRHHHENFDGSGYPDQVAGESIPVLSRIISIADCYDALTETRPYREAIDQQDAFRYIIEQKAQKFDAYLVDIFIRLLSENKDEFGIERI
jgi:HD-GYP domain-containing protein (c-di-GMP phosphodiesterase class II)